MSFLRSCALSAPFHAELLEAAAILERRGVGAAQMKLLGEIERKLFGPLGFDDPFVLLEDAPVLRVQLLVGFYIAIIASGETVKFSLVTRHRRTQINIGVPLDASGLAPLDCYHKWQDDRVQLFRRKTVGAKFVHRRIYLVLKTTLCLCEVDHRRLGAIGVAEDA